MDRSTDNLRRRPRLGALRALVGGLLPLLLPIAAVAAESCAPDDVLYISIETVREPLGIQGEDRKQYLDRVYGQWQEDSQEIVRLADATGADTDPLRITLALPATLAAERADVVVESRLDYLDQANARQEIYGYREVARYPLAVDAASAEIAVPRSVFREPSSLLVAVTARARDGSATRAVVVHPLAVTTNFCPRRVYTRDRFTAIRLNNRARKVTPRVPHRRFSPSPQR